MLCAVLALVDVGRCVYYFAYRGIGEEWIPDTHMMVKIWLSMFLFVLFAIYSGADVLPREKQVVTDKTEKEEEDDHEHHT